MISIIIPTYNCEKFVEQALQSVFNQTCKDFEIIVVDDGSTDETKMVLAPYMNKIRYEYKSNGGVASARNYGLSLAQGDYIAFLDADDVYKPGKLEKQLRLFQNDPAIDVVYNDVEVADEHLQYISTLKSEGAYEAKEDFFCMLLVRQIVPGPASIMLKRECIDRGIQYPEQYKNAEDYQFIIDLASHYQFKYLAEPLYIYRRHSGNLTNSHLQQLASDVSIVKDLGIERIQEIVQNSKFNQMKKKFILAKIYMKIQEWERAEALLTKLTKQDNEPHIWFYMGNCYYMRKKFTEAACAYEKAIHQASDMAEAYNNLGAVYGKLQHFNKAKQQFENALAIRKGYMDAMYNQAQLVNAHEQYKITMRELRKVLTLYS